MKLFLKNKDWDTLIFVFVHDAMLPDSGLQVAASVPLVPFIQKHADNNQLIDNLIAHGAGVNRPWTDEQNPDDLNVTPLQAAHRAGNQRLAVVLVEMGADPASISPTGGPLHVASSWAVNSKEHFVRCNEMLD